jgi:thiol:disulfide interchange protein DsbD
MKSMVRPLLVATFLLAVVLHLSAAQPGDDPFSETNQASAARPGDDPFSETNQAPAKHRDSKPRTVLETVQDRITFTAVVEPKEAKPGEIVHLALTGTPKPGFHTYPLTQRTPDQDLNGLSKLSANTAAGLRLLGPIVESAAEPVDEKGLGLLLEHAKPFTWSMDLLVLPEAKPGTQQLPIKIALQVCNDKNCLNGEIVVPVTVRILEGSPAEWSPELKKRLDTPLYEVKVVSSLPGLTGDKAKADGKGSVTSNTNGKITAESSLVHIIVLAGGAAFLMLLTPCVFPMIPITVSFFLKQAENKHNHPLLLASIYSLTITVLLSAAVLLLGSLVIQWANDPWMNLGMGVLLMFFALSLFGMYEIELPHFLSQYTSSREGQGGYVGVFFMALTFTITSFTCTGPFLGPLLAGAKEMRLSLPQLVVAAVAYSAMFAAPFFVLALFPSLLKAMPKSGGWLNAIKVVMGFVEVALAMKFFSIMDTALFPGNPRLFNYDTVLCTWIVLSAACGLYLLGIFRLPHDTPIEYVGVPRLLFATFFLGLAVYMTPALWRNRPLGVLGENIVAFLPFDTRPASAAEPGGNGAASELAWTRDYQKAWEQAKAEHKLLFIDFTGVNCQNCRYNEQNVFTRTEVRQELKSFILVQLYQDYVPDARLSQEKSREEAKRNMAWQENTFGDISLPLYIVLDPSGTSKPVTEDGKLAGVEKGRDSGAIYDIPAFVHMLAKARETKQVAQRP